MRRVRLLVLPVLLLFAGCTLFQRKSETLREARSHFVTQLTRHTNDSDRYPLPVPPPDQLRIVYYLSKVGKLAAYLSVRPKDGKLHPAIIWIDGGNCSSLDDVSWVRQLPDNDQSASVFRKQGIITMYPSLRGGNQNPGSHEGFYGEVDDVIAAEKFLALQPDVDPTRIYLGGHSTGGTMTMLAAELTSRFRAEFALGPEASVAGYPKRWLPFDTNNTEEVKLRSPGYWMSSVTRPLYVLEGTNYPSNIRALRFMRDKCTNPLIHFIPVPGYDHFSEVLPITELIARKILDDTGKTCQIDLDGGVPISGH